MGGRALLRVRGLLFHQKTIKASLVGCGGMHLGSGHQEAEAGGLLLVQGQPELPCETTSHFLYFLQHLVNDNFSRKKTVGKW